MKELTKESLEDAIAKIKELEDGSLVYDQNTMTYKTTGRYNLTNISSGSNRDGGLRVHGRPVEIRPFEVNPDMAMLEDASSPYNVDVETLANLWVARFGKGWVGNDAVEDMDADQVDWWRHAANRLRELGYLEMHTLASSYRVVLRIVE